jgi:hypothetical protein
VVAISLVYIHLPKYVVIAAYNKDLCLSYCYYIEGVKNNTEDRGGVTPSLLALAPHSHGQFNPRIIIFIFEMRILEGESTIREILVQSIIIENKFYRIVLARASHFSATSA